MTTDAAIVITSIGGKCPCQADGSFYGNPFYFRARHGLWRLFVVREGQDPLEDDPIFDAEGDDPSMGHMEIPDAMRAIGAAYLSFLKEKALGMAEGLLDNPAKA